MTDIFIDSLIDLASLRMANGEHGTFEFCKFCKFCKLLTIIFHRLFSACNHGFCASPETNVTKTILYWNERL